MAEASQELRDQVSSEILNILKYKYCIDYVSVAQGQTTAYQLDKAVNIAANGIENQEDCTFENLILPTKMIIKEMGTSQCNELE